MHFTTLYKIKYFTDYEIWQFYHYSEVTMGPMASQITSLIIPQPIIYHSFDTTWLEVFQTLGSWWSIQIKFFRIVPRDIVDLFRRVQNMPTSACMARGISNISFAHVWIVCLGTLH